MQFCSSYCFFLLFFFFAFLHHINLRKYVAYTHVLYISNECCPIGDVPFWIRAACDLVSYNDKHSPRSLSDTSLQALFPVQLKKYDHLESTKFVANNSKVIRPGNWCGDVWVYQELSVTGCKILAFLLSSYVCN